MRKPCPPELRGLSRFVEAVRTILYHEMFTLVGAVVLLAITHGRVNQLGFWTYVTLWWMHESAKLNVFFGVPNLGEEMLPQHLRYLASYMTRRPMNMFFPLSVTISTVVTYVFAARAYEAANHFDAAGYTMLATLMALAVAEHWFLVAPLNANALWGPLSKRPAGDASGLLEGEFAALESFVEAATPRELERAAAGLLRRPPSRACAGTGRGGRVRRGRGREGRDAHQGALDRLRDQWGAGAHDPVRAATFARAADRRDGPPFRSSEINGRARKLRGVRKPENPAWGG